MTEPLAGTEQKQHFMESGEAAFEEAIDAVIARARHTLHVFDVDLTRGGYSSLRRYEALQEFLLRSRSNRLTLVLHDIDFLTTRCPRLMSLLKAYSHAIAIHQTHEHARAASDPLLIADATHFIHRFHSRGARFLLALNDPAGAYPLEERFGQLLQASHPAVFATTLGL